ncbi:MAG: WzyE family oligosaccharide polymerase, partial [Arsenophonus sp. ET-DL12-MAG3]
MTLIEFGSLSIIYFISLILIFILIYYEYRQIRFNFNIFFSLLYLLIFYLGFPLTGLLIFKFNIKVVPLNSLLYELILSIGFYIIYYIAYKISLINIVKQSKKSLFTMNGVETRLTCFLLMFIAISNVCIFLLQNGFLLFSLQS